MDMADQFWGKRAANAYAYRTLHDKGTILAFGSDAPVESPNPFWGLHAAVTRRRHGGEPGPDGWYPMQRLSLAEALLGFTRGAAYAAGVDDRAGMIAPGYLADLIVLDVDPFAIDPQRLHAIQPRMTMVAGDWVWQA
jgi:predicted amidohydrolase YtcJ